MAKCFITGASVIFYGNEAAVPSVKTVIGICEASSFEEAEAKQVAEIEDGIPEKFGARPSHGYAILHFDAEEVPPRFLLGMLDAIEEGAHGH